MGHIFSSHNNSIDNLTNLLKGSGDLVLGSCTIFFSILTLEGNGRVLLRLRKAVCDDDDIANFLLSFAVLNRRSGSWKKISTEYTFSKTFTEHSCSKYVLWAPKSLNQAPLKPYRLAAMIRSREVDRCRFERNRDAKQSKQQCVLQESTVPFAICLLLWYVLNLN